MQGIENFGSYNYAQVKLPQNTPTYQTSVKNNTPPTDTFEGKNKKMSKTSKVLLSLAGLGAAAFATVYGVKKYNVTNIKNIQKAFNETFMRDDITPEMARTMKARYREIEKIKDPKEYAKALFEEAKKNYRMDDTDIKLIFEPNEKTPNSLGFCRRDNSAISITPEGLKNRKHILNTMHHEFRHAVQNRCTSSERYLQIKALTDRYATEFVDKIPDIKSYTLNYTDLTNLVKDIYKKSLKELRENGFPKNDKNILKRLQLEHELSKDIFVIPEKYNSFVDKIIENRIFTEYKIADKDFAAYWNNFIEQDARKAGGTIEKYVRSKAFMFKDWLSEFLYKSTK